eukprot:maker-scaffold_53-augustus-gene-1.22-mRNA-1 protein AED:0.44 eAED:0.44 QI:0/0/0/0.5/0/0/2/0/1183
MKAWDNFLKEVSKAAKRYLTIYDPGLELNIFSDSSDLFWSCVVTQCSSGELNKEDFLQQRHRPIMFFSGKFTGSQLKWHISSKEMYPMIACTARIDYLILGHPTPCNYFTDHKNLVYILSPTAADKRSYVDRLHRWSLRLQRFNVAVRHIEGTRNVFADMLSRRGNESSLKEVQLPGEPAAAEGNIARREGEEETKPEAGDIEVEQNVRRITRKSMKLAKNNQEAKEYLKELYGYRIGLFSPLFKEKWKPISEAEVRREQRSSSKLKPEEERLFKERKGYILRKKGKIWIPEKLVAKLILHNHCSEGHFSEHRELQTLKSRYSFEPVKDQELKQMIRQIRRKCLHCDKGPKLIRRPRSITQLGRRPREVLLMDYLYVDKSGYILVIVDSLSRKCQLTFHKECTAYVAAKSLLRWRNDVGFVQGFILFTDRGSHFCNELFTQMHKLFKFTQHFAISYSPFTNGGVETTNGPILKYLRSLVSEYRLEEGQWPDLIEQIAYYMNKAPSSSNDGLSPNEVIMLHKDEGTLLSKEDWALPLRYVETGRVNWRTPRDAGKVEGLIREMQSRLEEIWQRTYQYTSLLRAKRNVSWNSKKAVKVVQFGEGDWVMLSRAGTHTDRFKTKLKWTGPYKIMRTLSGNVYEIELLQGKKTTAHSTRLLWYKPEGYIPSAEVVKQFASDAGQLEVQQFTGLRHENGRYELCTRWKGFTEADDTWEPLDVIWEDVKHVVEAFFRKGGEDQMIREAKLFLETAQQRARAVKFWDVYEDEVLIGAIRKHGVGNYSAILSKNYLPGRSKQALYFRTQRLLGKQSIFEYRLLRLDARAVARFNAQRYGVEFYEEKTRVVPRWESLAKRWFNLKRFGLKSSAELEHVAFYRKNSNIQEKQESLEYLKMAKVREKFKGNILPRNMDIEETINKLEEEVAEHKRLEMRKVEKEKQLETILEEFRSRRASKLGRDEYASRNDERLKAKRIGTTWMYEVFSGNVSLGAGLIPPPGAYSVCADVKTLDWDEFIRTMLRIGFGMPEVMIVDPPWRVAPSNPSRGVALRYKTLSENDIKAIPISRLVPRGLVFYWVAKSKAKLVQEWMKQAGYKEKGRIVWVKFSGKKLVQPGPGNLVATATEECIVFQRGNLPSTMMQAHLGSDVILAPRRPDSRKPRELRSRIEACCGGCAKIEIFGRKPEVDKNWL